jgi:hypothetical protein
VKKNYKFKNHIKNNPYLTTLVSENSKVIYMKCGRTAGTSIHSTLNQIDVVEVSKPYFYGNGKNDWVENITDEEIKNDYFTFTFVRNPFERLISGWNAYVSSGKVESNFGKFIKHRGTGGYWLYKDGSISNDHWFPQNKYVEFSADNNERFINFVGKFENLEEDWKIVSEKIGIQNQIRKNKYRTTKEYYRSYYTEELIEIVSDFYKRDLELFNYEF